MSYPIPNYERVWVRGSIIDLTKAARGEEFYGVGLPITFTPAPKALINRGTRQIIMTGPFKIDTSKEDGYFQVQLPPTDDPDIIPHDFTYRVIEPGTGRAYDFKLPHDTPYLDEPGSPLHGERVLDLSSVVPAPSPSAGVVQLLSGRGVWDVWMNEANELEGEYTDGVRFNAGVVSVASVNGYDGVVVLDKADIGLGNADNTSDMAKPVSSAQQAAITSAAQSAQSAAEGSAGAYTRQYTDSAVSGALSGHTGASDPHTQYLTNARGDARYRRPSDPVTAPGVNGLSSARFVGIKATTGVPTSGAWSAGDMAYNQTDRKWMLCTNSGSPGTWTIQP